MAIGNSCSKDLNGEAFRIDCYYAKKCLKMRKCIDETLLDEVLQSMGVDNIERATIRQLVAISCQLEAKSGNKFIHFEMGIPGLAPESVGVEAEINALKSGVASQYPNIFGIPEFKEQASRFIKAFIDVEVAPLGCLPTVGSMQGSFAAFMICSQLSTENKKILFIDPGFPVQRTQANMLNIESVSFDIYEYRAERLKDKLESYLSQGDIAAVIYSNPNNPAWICMTDDELRTIGELATKYDTIVIEDLAYLCMDFRKPLGRPFEAPYQSSVAKYTDNYMLLLSGSKIFSYAGQRISVAAISETLYHRTYESLKKRYNIGKLGEAYTLGVLHATSSGTSHSAQYALAAMFKSASDGELDFVGKASEYARRAKISKEIFINSGFHIVYDKDLDEELSDGFFFTVGFSNMGSGELIRNLLLCGISAISLPSTGSYQEGVRICVSQINDDAQFGELENRLQLFNNLVETI